MTVIRQKTAESLVVKNAIGDLVVGLSVASHYVRGRDCAEGAAGIRYSRHDIFLSSRNDPDR